jgi:Trk-type K+ transport system membrane component
MEIAMGKTEIYIIIKYETTVTSLPPGIRVLDGFFQAVSTRTAGFGVVNLSEIAMGKTEIYIIIKYET